MASVSKNDSGFFIRVYLDGKQSKISGFSRRKEAERVCERITELERAKKKTAILSDEMTLWVSKLADTDTKLYQRLVTLGLMEERRREYTLGELTARFIEQFETENPKSKNKFYQTEVNLHEFFGVERRLRDITLDDADKFRYWLRTARLNRRNREKVVYAEATVNRRIKIVKQMFQYAIRCGMLDKSPMQFLRGGESVNKEKWEYVPAEPVLKVIEECPSAKWRTIIALARFCGVRGSSELFQLTWEDVHWSTATEPFKVYINSTKNKRHDKGNRLIQPIHGIVEECFRQWFENAPEGQPKVFPGMKKGDNLGTPIEKYIRGAGVPVWKVPLYNMRKSFCCDFIEWTDDPKFYEYVTDHSFTIAMRHYQILYPERMVKGFKKQRMLPENTSLAPGTSVSACKNLDETDFGVVRQMVRQETEKGYVQGIPSNGEISQRDSQTPVFYDSTQEKQNACNCLQACGMPPPDGTITICT